MEALIIDVGAARLKAVYDLSEVEIRSDTHGLAREFELKLRPDVDQDAAIDTLIAKTTI